MVSKMIRGYIPALTQTDSEARMHKKLSIPMLLLIASIAFFNSCSLFVVDELSDEDIADITAAELASYSGGDTLTLERSALERSVSGTSTKTGTITTPRSTLTYSFEIIDDTNSYSYTSNSSGTVDRIRLSGSFDRSHDFTVQITDGAGVAATTIAAGGYLVVSGTSDYDGQYTFERLIGTTELSVSSISDRTWSSVQYPVTAVSVDEVSLGSPVSGSISISGSYDRERSGIFGRSSSWVGDLVVTFLADGTAEASFDGDRTVTIDMSTGVAE
jgi:hypothetical protein